MTTIQKIFKIFILIVIWSGTAYSLFKVWNLFVADEFFASGMSSGRLEGFQKAVGLNPMEETYWRNLGLACAISSKIETVPQVKAELKKAGATYLEEAVRLNPDNILTLKTAVLGYNELGDGKQAQKILKLLQTRIPTDKSVWEATESSVQ